VPEGLEVLGDDPNVTVRLEISAIQTGQTRELQPVQRGLGEGLEASLSPNEIQVILFGPVPDLDALKPGDVQVVVDLTDLGPGTYKLTPQVVNRRWFRSGAWYRSRCRW